MRASPRPLSAYAPRPPGMTFQAEMPSALRGCRWLPSDQLADCLQGSPLATFITPLILSLARLYFILIFISTLTEDLSLRGGFTLVKLMRPIYKIRYQVSNLQRGITNARTENFEVHINSVFFFFFGCQMILYFSFFFAVLN